MLYFGNSNINVYLLSTDLTALYFFWNHFLRHLASNPENDLYAVKHIKKLPALSRQFLEQ